MEVKGVAIISMRDYVRNNFGSRYDEWLNSLSAPCQNVLQTVLSSGWYPLQAGIIEPTRKICDLFHDEKEEGAWKIGRYSAEHALRGAYSIYVKLATSGFILSRGSRIMSQYYAPCVLNAFEDGPNRGVIQILEFAEPSRLIELRIGGWIERALEIGGKKLRTAALVRSLASGDPMTELVFEWQ
jgi:hypothetical protein